MIKWVYTITKIILIGSEVDKIDTLPIIIMIIKLTKKYNYGVIDT